MKPVHNTMVSALALSTILAGCTSDAAQDPGPEPLAGHTLEHTTTNTNTPPEPGPIPTTVTDTAWTWEGTPGTTIHAIHPTPTGALIHLNNGLIGLDTTTGQEAWSYQLPDATDLDEEDTDLALTPDATTAAFTPGHTTALLDTATGQEHQRLGHNTEPDDNTLFTPDRLGLPHTNGNLTTTNDNGLHLTLTPWNQDQNTGWDTALPACDNNDTAQLDQGLATDDTAITVHTCPGQEPTLTGIDINTGEHTWTLQQGNDYQPNEEHIYTKFPSHHEPEFITVGDLLVLENISLQSGTVVIDTTTGDVITDDLLDTFEEDLLRILPDGYLSVVSNISEHDRLRYELRDFDGTVKHTISTDTNTARGDTHSFVPLEESLVKLRSVEEDEQQDIAVWDWDTDKDHRIPIDIDVDITGILNGAELDREVGPLTYREVPGAVLLREFPEKENPRLTALR